MTMDLNDLRIIITSLSFVVFIAIVFWAYSGRQRVRFSEAANLPFVDSDLPGETLVASTETHSGGRP